MDVRGQNVLVFGSGKSGIGACRLLERQGASVILYDGNAALCAEELKEKIGCDSIEVILGELPEEVIEKLTLAVLSPGVPTDIEPVNRMREKGVKIWGEIELAYTYGKGDVLAITGTNGKTTTTTLLGEIMKAWKESVFVVGNIGNPYTEEVEKMTGESVTVAEISSFQLETIEKFCPKISAILNITPDHLNRHHTMEAYIEAKKAIAKNQGAEEYCVLNYEDEALRSFGEEIQTNVFYFSSRRTLSRGIYLENGNMIYRDGEQVTLCHVEELKLLGVHNYENVMAAAAMALLYKVPVEVVREVILKFTGVEHRIEFVAEKHGVFYYNDSKGTNPDAAIRGIRAMNRPTCLIGGGYDKESEYDEWIQAFDGKVKKFVLLGKTREKIAACARKYGFPEEDILMADTFEEAVAFCTANAQPGDAVLLSPACASWGMFKNYEERGDKFKELVNAL